MHNVHAKLGRIVATALMVAAVTMPVAAAAQTFTVQFNSLKCFLGGNEQCLIPCGGGGAGTGESECTFQDFLQLFANLVFYMVLISVPIAAIMFAYAGFKIMTSQGGAGLSQGKTMMVKVLIGFVFILAAWIIVSTIVNALVTSEFSIF